MSKKEDLTTALKQNALSDISSKVSALLTKSLAYEKENDFKSALESANEAWELFQLAHEQNDALKAQLLYHLSQLHLKRQEYEQLAEYSEPLLELSRKLNDGEKEVSALTSLAITKGVQSDYKTAMPIFVEALDKSRQLGLRNNQANCLINIGNIYANLFNYQEALDRYKTVLTEYNDVITEDTRIIISLNTGNLYYAIDNYQLSLEYFNQALKAASRLDKKRLMTRAYVLSSRTYLEINNLKKAIEATQKAATLMEDVKKPNWLQINYLNLAQIDFLSGNTEGGYTWALKGIVASRQLNDDVSELRGFKLLSDIFKKEKKYKLALRSQMIYSRKQQDYLNKQRDMHFLDFEIRYALSEKERRIEALTKENRYQAVLLERNSQIEKQNEQLRQANEELQQFAYISSHDLKEPLRMIGSFTQIIERQYADKLGDESKSYFNYISEGVSRMHGLLDALLQYATIGKVDLEFEPVDVQDVVRKAKANLQLKIEETYTSVLCGEMPVVKGVSSFLVQLFQNLIGNAIKFRKEEGRPIILINAVEQEKDWLFSVEDNGIGIAEEHKERIFIIFQRLHKRTKYEGTGIGLAICHKIVTQLKGKIWVTSEMGKGSTFYFTIPK
jgi:signal transduction histidine kinase